MKKYFLYLLFPIVAFSCNSGPSAKDYYEMGVEKLKGKINDADRSRIGNEALADFDKAIELKPEYVDALDRRAVLKRGLGDYNGSIKDAEKIIDINPKSSEPWFFIGETKFLHNDYSGSANAYDKAIAIDSTKAFYYYYKAMAEKEMNNLTGALKDLDHGIAIGTDSSDPSKKSMYLMRGDIELKITNKIAACTDFYKALALGDKTAQSYIDDNCK
jgi:tetratricopeptide (TPR) repeat protein